MACARHGRGQHESKLSPNSITVLMAFAVSLSFDQIAATSRRPASPSYFGTNTY
jgi:hypothetical protein